MQVCWPICTVMAEKQRFVSDMTLRQAVATGARALSAAGIGEAHLDSKLLLAHVIGGDRLTLVCDADRSLRAVELDNYSKLIDERKDRKPTSRIIGRREFWSLELQISDKVFDPRPDSETLIAAALAQMPNKTGNYVIADFGTGSGCLLLAVLAERPGAWGLGLDYSHASVQQAMENARNLRLNDRARFMVGDWGEALSGSFDLILTMESGQKESLQMEFSDFSDRIFLLSEMVDQKHDIDDPYGGVYSEYEQAADEIEEYLLTGFDTILQKTSQSDQDG